MPKKVFGAEKNRNLGPGDSEIAEFAQEILPGHFDLPDLSHGRALLQPSDQVFQALFFALGQNLDSAIQQVPYPARETKRGRPAPGVIAEENPLHTAGDKDMSPGFHRLYRYANIAPSGRKAPSWPLDRTDGPDG